MLNLHNGPGTRSIPVTADTVPGSVMLMGRSGFPLRGRGTVSCTSPPPLGKNPRRTSTSSASTPKRRKSGIKTRHISSMGGDQLTSVPPRHRKQLGLRVNSKHGIAICAKRVQLPAVPVSTSKSPSRNPFGHMATSVELGFAPTRRPPHNWRTILMPCRCCGRSPGGRRPPRILVSRIGCCASAAKENPFRRICPPPASPSTVIMGLREACCGRASCVKMVNGQSKHVAMSGGGHEISNDLLKSIRRKAIWPEQSGSTVC